MRFSVPRAVCVKSCPALTSACKTGGCCGFGTRTGDLALPPFSEISAVPMRPWKSTLTPVSARNVMPLRMAIVAVT